GFVSGRVAVGGARIDRLSQPAQPPRGVLRAMGLGGEAVVHPRPDYLWACNLAVRRCPPLRFSAHRQLFPDRTGAACDREHAARTACGLPRGGPEAGYGMTAAFMRARMRSL